MSTTSVEQKAYPDDGLGKADLSGDNSWTEMADNTVFDHAIRIVGLCMGTRPPLFDLPGQWEVALATGEAASEVEIARVPGVISVADDSRLALGSGVFIFPLPIEIPANTRIAGACYTNNNLVDIPFRILYSDGTY